MEEQLVSKLDATPEPNHFNAFQARQEHDLINLQDLLEALWIIVTTGERANEASDIFTDLYNELAGQVREAEEFLRRLRMISGIELEFPTREQRRAYLRANNMG